MMDLRGRALQDILDAEREMRARSETRVRELVGVLTELAYRLDGKRLEAERERDPLAPESWSAEQWRSYFALLALERGAAAWVKPGQAQALAQELVATKEKLAAALGEAQALRDQLATMQAQAAALAAPRLATTGEQRVTSTATAAPSVIREAVESVATVATGWPKEWPKVPARLLAKLTAAGVPVAEGTRWDRLLAILWLVAVRGMSLRIEVMDAVKVREALNSRSGSLGRLFDVAATSGLLESEVLSLALGQGASTNLALVRLGKLGRELAGAIGWPGVETEWERVRRLHQGDAQPEHTCALLAFAYHARLRGGRVEVLPTLSADNSASPDVLVEHGGERVYVEVELGQDKVYKWRNLAALQGFVALCAPTVLRRMALVSECRLDGLAGRATDLETLIATQGSQKLGTELGPLWIETW